MTKTFENAVSPGLLTAMVRGERLVPVSAAVVQTRKRWPVLRLPAEGLQ
jgi:hypothetical protein